MSRLAILAALILLAGCGGGGPEPVASQPKELRLAPRPWPKLPHCPAHAGNCKAARGTIVYIEAVDPDGDGDAHFVLASTQSITGPGLTVIDVEKSLRPHPLPHLGARVAAAGPVYPGSHGQMQIQATVLRVRR